MDVPEVLVSGNHKLIDEWKFKKALELTKERRPDMLEAYIEDLDRFTKSEKKIIEEIMKRKL